MYPDITIFSSLKERDLRREGLIIGEGSFLAGRLASSCPLVAAAAVPEAAGKMEGITRGRCPVFTLSRAALSDIAGYDFHRGMLLAAKRPADVLLAGHPLIREGSRLVLCAGISDPENLGAIIRSAAALGWEGIALDGSCADPFSRKALRCSMGAVLGKPLIRIESPGDLDGLKKNGWTLAGAVLNDGAVSPEALKTAGRLALVFGNEGFGIPEPFREKCDVSVRIPQLQNGFVDSLNVAAAAAILLWEGRIAAG